MHKTKYNSSWPVAVNPGTKRFWNLSGSMGSTRSYRPIRIGTAVLLQKSQYQVLSNIDEARRLFINKMNSVVRNQSEARNNQFPWQAFASAAATTDTIRCFSNRVSWLPRTATPRVHQKAKAKR